MKATIAVLPGDGIGPEVTRAAQAALDAVAETFGHEFTFEEAPIGGCAIDATGTALPRETAMLARNADATLLGAVGGPQWSDPDAEVRPEQGLLALRQELDVCANLRPVVPHPQLYGASPLKAELLEGVDIMVIRELTSGIYFGERTRTETSASDLCVYNVEEIERIVWTACMLARNRRGKLTSVDKANVLETSRLWRATTERVVRTDFPDIELEHMLVDAMTMHLLSRPRDFDVIVTENMFGDILTDEASMLVGSLGLLPSASLSGHGPGLYEPVHGSAPDIAGRGIANPYGAILTTAMMLRHSWQLEDEATAVEEAVSECIAAGVLTPDLCSEDATPATTGQVTRAVATRIQRAPARATA